MKKVFVAVALYSCMVLSSKGQSLLGDVACVYITTTDLDSSAAVYQKLGFEITGTNTFPSPWMQLSDGSLLIMLRKDPQPYIGLTYYSDAADSIAAKLEAAGIRFTQKPREGDAIWRYYFKTPDRFNIMLATNLGGFKQPRGLTMATMNPTDFSVDEKYPNRLCGVFGEFCHPVSNLDSTILYWTKLGFTVKYHTSSVYPHAILTDGLMIIGLHQTDHFNYPAITYFGKNIPEKTALLKQKGLTAFSESGGRYNQVLTTWEQQHFFIFSIGL
ncbi:MAG: VOC family protein [Bacteroidetes bacterium]|nr:VOC family protein [Bacteroidota bacterium]